MAGNLLQPRVRVSWGEVNLSAYNGSGPFPQGNPLVYDVEVDLQKQTQAPTGTMKWDPSGPAFKVYESFISSEEYMKTRIYVDYFYVGGKRLRLAFVWAGQSVSYGVDMSVTVMLKTELDGQVNGNIRNHAQAHDEKKGASMTDALEKLSDQYKADKDLVKLTAKAEEDMKKAKVSSVYGQDQTYAAAVSNLAQQNGNTIFAHNIESPGMVVYTPFSWDKEGEVINAVEVPAGEGPKPEKRYGYLLGPSIISTLTRTSEWVQPQQTTQNTPSTQTRAQKKRKKKNQQQNPPTSPENQLSDTQKPGSAPQGTANARANPGVQNVDNPDGATKQNLLTEEGGAKMNFQTMLLPVLVGIKPHDIVYVPSLTGDFIEDWIVDNVSYDQNDGRVSVSVSAQRVLGQGEPMNKSAAEKFTSYAKTNGLIGPNATLEAWERYAWSLPRG